jgi:uncharacterized protein (TIGR00730 family)
MKNICVYCSSSDAVASIYRETARALGVQIAARGDTLVYGGSNVGLMGELARAVHAGDGRIVGVIPQAFQARGIGYAAADEIIITRDLRERKATMEARADAFIALPGGLGTLEELLEVLTLRQLQAHTKPIILLNTADYYAPLLTLFAHFCRERFAKPFENLYHVADDVNGIFDYLDTYHPSLAPSKWFALEEK